jgi:hypothetical protein
MTDQFRFINTEIYKQFGECLTIQLKQLTVDDEEWYKNQLIQLRETFNCKHIPTDDQINTYIDTTERLDLRDIPSYMGSVRFLFEALFKINKHLEKITIKHQEKQIRKNEKLQDKKIANEIKEKEKLEKETIDNEMVQCDECGEFYKRVSKYNHLQSIPHRSGVKAIEWYIASRPSVSAEGGKIA